MIRKWIALGLVAGLSVFSACSTATTTSTTTTTVATTATSPSAPESTASGTPIEQIAGAMANVQTYSMTMTMKVDSSMAKTKTKTEAVVDVSDPSSSKMKGTTTTSGIEVKMIKVGDKIWVNGGTTNGKWRKLPAASAETMAADSADVKQALEQMQKAVADTKTVGTETIDGVETTHYRFTIDVAAYNKELGTAGALTGNTFDYDLWADSEGLMRKMETTMKLKVAGQKIETTMSATLSDFNEPVTIEAP